jgi:hypothetical protein
VQVDPPATDLINATVFQSDATAKAAIAGLYSQLSSAEGFSGGSLSSMTYLGGLVSDELENHNLSPAYVEYSTNSVLPDNVILTSSLWTIPYAVIYKTNAVLEGLENSNITPELKTQIAGEAKFIRAFTHFYLANLFGGIPIVLTSDYRVNSTIKRASAEEVYQQITQDLIDAQKLLSPDYSFSNHERVRPNKFAATALLARVYLYLKDYAKAEEQATTVIDNTALYGLPVLSEVFVKNSNEAIWQLSRDDGNANDAITFTIVSTPDNAALRSDWVVSFDPGDQRRLNWIGTSIAGSSTYYYPTKYRETAPSPITEYSMVLRLAEQYLIRAEARINQPGKITDGITDLNMLRKRASLPSPDNLPPLPLELSKEDAMIALENERQFELFTEWGHRWLDLKRWPSRLSPGDNTLNRADDILQPLKPGWKKEWKLLPIPRVQILNDPGMAGGQNPGYN